MHWHDTTGRELRANDWFDAVQCVEDLSAPVFGDEQLGRYLYLPTRIGILIAMLHENLYPDRRPNDAHLSRPTRRNQSNGLSSIFFVPLVSQEDEDFITFGWMNSSETSSLFRNFC